MNLNNNINEIDRSLLFMKYCNYINDSNSKNNCNNSYNIPQEKIYILYNYILYFLENYNIDLNIKNEDGFGLIHIVLYSDFYDHIKYKIIESFIKYRINLNSKDSDGNSILYTIIKLNDIYLMKLLIKSGVDINSYNNSMITPLNYSIIINNISMVKILLENNVIINKNDFFTCILNNRDMILNMLFDYFKKRNGISENKKMLLYHMYVAIGKNNIKQQIIDILKNNNIVINDCDIDEYSVLQYAVIYNNIDIIRFLIKKSPDYLELRNFNKSVGTINNKLDIDHKNKLGNTALHIAGTNLNYDAIKLLLDANADINAKNNDGNTILHELLKNEIVNYNIENTAVKIEIKDKDINDSEIENKKLDIIKLLLDNNKLDINTCNNDGNSIIHYAFINKKYLYISLILESAKNINFNIVNNDGYSLLHMSIKYNSFYLFKILLKYNIDIGLKTTRNKTLFHYIAKHTNVDIIKYIIQNNYMNSTEKQNNYMNSTEQQNNCMNSTEQQNNCMNSTEKQNNCMNSASQQNNYMNSASQQNNCMNEKDIDGFTPFFIAVKHNNIKIVKYMIENCNFEYNTVNNNGLTPLQYAKNKKYKKIVELLSK